MPTLESKSSILKIIKGTFAQKPGKAVAACGDNLSRLAMLSLIIGSLGYGQNQIGRGEVVDLYKKHCSICHGADLDGGVGGSLLGKLDYVNDDESITLWITEGNEELGMPAFGRELSDSEVRSLVIYLREKRQLKAGENQPSISDATSFSTKLHAFKVEKVIEGLSTPWAMEFLPSGGMIITEREGNVHLYEIDKLSKPIEGTPEVWSRGQGGMLDVALDPEYETNGWIYLTYSESRDGGETGLTAVSKGRIKNNNWTDEKKIFRAYKRHYSNKSFHFGSRIVIDGDYLYFSIGDRGSQDLAQDLSKPNGKIHRITTGGKIPEDNPFVGEADKLESIYSYGHRNPQGLVLDEATGKLWESEHGPRGGDEINLIEKGLNYGWPVITHGMNYNGTPITGKTADPGMEQPEHYWTPSIAVCGIDIYRGKSFPKWEGNLFAGGLSTEELHRLVIDGDRIMEDEIILKGMGRIRDVKSGPDGYLYLVLNGPDQIVRLVPVEK